MKTLFDFLGRVSLSLIFVASAAHKLLDWDGTVAYLTDGLSKWQTYGGGLSFVQDGVSFLLPLAPLLLLLGVFFEAVGGLLVLLGVQVRSGATLLILFLLAATLLFHPFWFLQGEDRQFQLMMLMKNLSILGGLFLLVAYSGSSSSAGKE